MHMWVICLGGFSFCNSCDVGMSDLPDMYAQSPRATGLKAKGILTYQANHEYPMLQLICNTFLVSCAQAKSSVE